jgi:uncharacterized membrane protein
MELKRWLGHLLLPGWWVRRRFSEPTLLAVERAIGESERTHRGELRFVVEGPLHLGTLLRGETARQRAVDLFSSLRIWDTQHNNGVLIYVQLVDRRVEIVADRGISARVPAEQWSEICHGMESAFRANAFQRGALEAVDRAGRLLATYFPSSGVDRANELPDRPLLLE